MQKVPAAIEGVVAGVVATVDSPSDPLRRPTCTLQTSWPIKNSPGVTNASYSAPFKPGAA